MNKYFKKVMLCLTALTMIPSAAFSIATSDTENSSIVASAADSNLKCTYLGTTFTYEYPDSGDQTSVIVTGISALQSQYKGQVTVPKTIKTADGKTRQVTEIGDKFGVGTKGLRSISLPESVVTIGERFAAYTSIESVYFPTSLRYIGSECCYQCESLSSVIYNGTDVTLGGRYSFSGTRYIKSREAVIFGNILLQYNGNATNLKISNLGSKIKKLGSYAFAQNKTLKSVDLTGVEYIGQLCFDGCKALTSITNTDSVTDIGSHPLGMASSYTVPPYYYDQRNQNGYVILGSILLEYAASKMVNKTIDLTTSEFKNITYIAPEALKNAAKTATTLKLSKNIKTVGYGAYHSECNPSQYAPLSTVYWNGTLISPNNMTRINMMPSDITVVLLYTKWGEKAKITKTKNIFSSLGITYRGNADNYNLSLKETCKIVKKLYDYVGSTYKYKYDYLGGSQNYIEEMFQPKGFVCRDYAGMYMYFLESAGVQCEIVHSPGIHAWNIVKINGKWFHVDTCWYNSKLFLYSTDAIEQIDSHGNISMPSRNDTSNSKNIVDDYMKTLTTMPNCDFTFRLGDANNSGSSTLADASLILSSLANPDKYGLSESGRFNADVNLDGALTASDAQKLQLALLNSTTYPDVLDYVLAN